MVGSKNVLEQGRGERNGKVAGTVGEAIRHINGVELCTESFGSTGNPCVLLIMGAMASMVWWDTEFCERLAKRGLFVIRFDNRDVGRSVSYPPGEIHYSMHDLADDAVAVLDSYGIANAHFVGMSLGGMIAQVVALKYPKRISSITAIASGVFADRPDLPPIEERILAYHSKATDVNWADEESVRPYLVAGWKLLNGTRHPFDEEQAVALADAEIHRARCLTSMFNHAQLKGAEELFEKVASIRLPLLVIHGTLDPVLPYPHAVALAETIPGSKLVALEGAGHEIHKNDWNLLISEIASHISNITK